MIYDDHRGGYINNVPATFTRKDTDIGIHYGNYATGCSAGVPTGGVCPGASTVTAYGVPPGSPSLNNSNLVGNAINPVTYQGIRAEALYKFNEDWNLLVTQSYQEHEFAGRVLPAAQRLRRRGAVAARGHALQSRLRQGQVREHGVDVERQARTPSKAVYTGGYLDRNVDQVGDYTNYARGVYADYYQCMARRRRATRATRRAPPGIRPSRTSTSRHELRF